MVLGVIFEFVAFFTDVLLLLLIISCFDTSISRLIPSILSQEDLHDILDMAMYFAIVDESMTLDCFFNTYIIGSLSKINKNPIINEVYSIFYN